VELLDDVLWRNTNSADEEFGTGVNDDLDQIVELSLGVVVAVLT